MGEKLENTKHNLKMLGVMAQLGQIKGERYFITTGFDYYRRFSSWLIVAAIFYGLFADQLMFAGICAIALHLHVLYNQLWWKHKSMENFLEFSIMPELQKKGENGKCSSQ